MCILHNHQHCILHYSSHPPIVLLHVCGFDDVKHLLQHEECSAGGPWPVPVVIFDGEELHVRPSNAGPYVAISHVWADGLGSKTEVGLPKCQVA